MNIKEYISTCFMNSFMILSYILNCYLINVNITSSNNSIHHIWLHIHIINNNICDITNVTHDLIGLIATLYVLTPFSSRMC